MKRSEKSTKILSKLNELYPNPQIPLIHNNPFTLLVAVMLSAQSTDKKVNQVTPILFAVAKTPAEMVKLKVEHIEQLIREIGLAPTKAKNIHRMSQQLIDTYQGEVPEKLEEMETWDSIAVLSCLSEFDDQMEIIVDGQELADCKNPQEIINLLSSN